MLTKIGTNAVYCFFEEYWPPYPSSDRNLDNQLTITNTSV